MDFLGIGPLELLFVLVIALIVLGPRDIARFARSAGRALNRIYRSEAWGAINKASREFRNLPNRLAREAALDDLDQSIRKAGKKDDEQADESADELSAWQPSPKSASAPDSKSDSADSAAQRSETQNTQSASSPPEPAQDD